MKRRSNLRRKALQPKKKRIALPGERATPGSPPKTPKSKRSSTLRRKKMRPTSPEEITKLNRDMAAFKLAANSQVVCAKCGRGGGPWDAHHVISRSFLKRYGYPQWHPDNALRLHDVPCHANHTNAFERLPLTCLLDQNVAYAVRLLGEDGAYSYLTRNYAGTDPRVDQILEDSAA